MPQPATAGRRLDTEPEQQLVVADPARGRHVRRRRDRAAPRQRRPGAAPRARRRALMAELDPDRATTLIMQAASPTPVRLRLVDGDRAWVTIARWERTATGWAL